jgi:hypothetical protein
MPIIQLNKLKQKQNNMQKQTAINLVSNNISSVFTKEDVINLLKSIDADPKLASEDETDEVDEIHVLTDETIKELIEHVQYSIDSLFLDDIIDKDTASFSLDGNSIILEDVDMTGNLEDIVGDSIEEFFRDLKRNNK